MTSGTVASGRLVLGWEVMPRSTGVRSERLIQGAGLVVWAMIGIETFVPIGPVMERELRAGLPTTLDAAQAERALRVATSLFWIFALGAFTLFGVAFAWSAARVREGRPSRLVLAVLAAQVLIALTVSTDLLLLVAAEVPFLLAGRAAMAWIAGQGLVGVAATLRLAGSSGFEPLPRLEGFPPVVVVCLTALSFVAWQGLAFCAGYVAATEVRARRELGRTHAALAATSGLLAESGRLGERLRIARELHDAAGHHLAALTLNLELASRLASEPVARPVEEALGVTRLLFAEVREVVGELRGAAGLDLETALETLVEGIEEPRIQLDLAPGLVVEPRAAHVLFRAAQEGVTNALRHAAATTVVLSLAREREGLRFTVRDDGRGAATWQPGNGLAGMRERLAELGGELVVTTSPGHGFTLTAWLPEPGAGA